MADLYNQNFYGYNNFNPISYHSFNYPFATPTFNTGSFTTTT